MSPSYETGTGGQQEASLALATRDVVHLVSVGGVATYPGKTNVITDEGFCPTDEADCVCVLLGHGRKAVQGVRHDEAPLPPTFKGIVGSPWQPYYCQ